MIEQLLKPNPTERITLEEVLQHSFLALSIHPECTIEAAVEDRPVGQVQNEIQVIETVLIPPAQEVHSAENVSAEVEDCKEKEEERTVECEVAAEEEAYRGKRARPEREREGSGGGYEWYATTMERYTCD